MKTNCCGLPLAWRKAPPIPCRTPCWNHAQEQRTTPAQTDTLTEISGSGLRAEIDGAAYLLGSPAFVTQSRGLRWMRRRFSSCSNRENASLCCARSTLLGCIAFADHAARQQRRRCGAAHRNGYPRGDAERRQPRHRASHRSAGRHHGISRRSTAAGQSRTRAIIQGRRKTGRHGRRRHQRCARAGRRRCQLRHEAAAAISPSKRPTSP